MSLHLLRGTVQHYAWGDTTAIPRWMNQPTDGRPWAELWFGTHRNGATTLRDSDDALSSMAGNLPYLVKVLAAAQPLSLQTHPSAEQAAEGFSRETSAGIALDDPRRIYVDASPKPEFVYALDEFEAVCGFLPADVAIGACRSAGADALGDHLQSHGLAATARDVIAGSRTFTASRPPAHLAAIARHHPGDPRTIVALLMHHVMLSPGDTLFLESGNVHAYLRGTAIEVMSSSDNVVRAAFTSKHVDVDEFLRVATLAPTAPVRPVAEQRRNPAALTYRIAEAPFVIDVVGVAGETTWTVPRGGAIVVPAVGAIDSLPHTAAFADEGVVQLHGHGTVVIVSSA